MYVYLLGLVVNLVRWYDENQSGFLRMRRNWQHNPVGSLAEDRVMFVDILND